MSAVTQASTPSEILTFKLLLYLLIFIWIIAIGDASSLGKKKDK